MLESGDPQVVQKALDVQKKAGYEDFNCMNECFEGKSQGICGTYGCECAFGWAGNDCGVKVGGLLEIQVAGAASAAAATSGGEYGVKILNSGAGDVSKQVLGPVAADYNGTKDYSGGNDSNNKTKIEGEKNVSAKNNGTNALLFSGAGMRHDGIFTTATILASLIANFARFMFVL
jgi:hypothetical protein